MKDKRRGDRKQIDEWNIKVEEKKKNDNEEEIG